MGLSSTEDATLHAIFLPLSLLLRPFQEVEMELYYKVSSFPQGVDENRVRTALVCFGSPNVAFRRDRAEVSMTWSGQPSKDAFDNVALPGVLRQLGFTITG